MNVTMLKRKVLQTYLGEANWKEIRKLYQEFDGVPDEDMPRRVEQALTPVTTEGSDQGGYEVPAPQNRPVFEGRLPPKVYGGGRKE